MVLYFMVSNKKMLVRTENPKDRNYCWQVLLQKVTGTQSVSIYVETGFPVTLVKSLKSLFSKSHKGLFRCVCILEITVQESFSRRLLVRGVVVQEKGCRREPETKLPLEPWTSLPGSCSSLRSNCLHLLNHHRNKNKTLHYPRKLPSASL